MPHPGGGQREHRLRQHTQPADQPRYRLPSNYNLVVSLHISCLRESCVCYYSLLLFFFLETPGSLSLSLPDLHKYYLFVKVIVSYLSLSLSLSLTHTLSLIISLTAPLFFSRSKK